jgi:signal transduction histidine kinase
LIVDDHPGNVEILEDILGDDYPLATASSGEEALLQAQSFRPALILLDIMMPGIDGYDTCRQLRTMPALQHTKIVMVSAKAMASERIKGYAVGADDYIIKPFDLEELRAKVRVYLRLKTMEELHQLKSDVLMLLSHETATPLNGILGLLDLVQDTPDMDPDERFELLEMVRQSATRLHTLYTKSLTLGALRSGQRLLDTASVDIWELAEDAIAVMTPQAAAKEVELALSGTEATPTQLDSQLIHDVIVALLANAIRVSPSPGRVEVRVWQDSEHLYVSVSDQGPGIDPTFLPYVFEPFAQPDLCHHSSGQGLSLAIAHAVLEAHSGTIGVESESGQGARFTFRLPVVSR